MISTGKKIKVLTNSVPYAGHYISLLRIAEALASRQEFQVTFSTSDHQIQKIKPMSERIKKLPLHDDCEQIKIIASVQTPPSFNFDKPWQKPLEEFVEKQKPSVILCDSMSAAAMRIGRKYNIPTVIHIYLPCGIMNLLNIPALSKNLNFLGLTIIDNFKYSLLPKGLKHFVDLGQYFDTSLVLFCSFHGLEDAVSLPPNFKMIGSTLERKNFKPQFDEDLQVWLTKMKKQNKDLIYVSFGSVVLLSQSFVNFLYEGLKKLNFSVIWSLKKGKLPEQNPNFYVSTWLPQTSILSLDQVKVFMTHCGWNAVMEGIHFQKPMICLPVTVDQPENADLVVKRGIGIILRSQKSPFLIPFQINDPKFTHEQLESKINRLITEPGFKENLAKLKVLETESEGMEGAIRLIKNAALHGVDHLVDKNLKQIRQRSIKPFLLFLLVLLMFAIYFFFFLKDKDEAL